MLLLAPVVLVFYRTFEHGFCAGVARRHEPQGRGHALWVTLQITLIVVPLNAIFGVLTAIAIVRHRFPAKGS